MKFDFSGYATKHNVKCSDGRTIMKDAFVGNDGTRVPLVWHHLHDDPSNVLGYALLEHRPEGVYARCKFNNSRKGQEARELVMHGDIDSMSIHANNLVQKNGQVLNGVIREVSLVTAGANPEAKIDNVAIMHGDEFTPIEDEAVINFYQPFDEIMHADDRGKKKTVVRETEEVEVEDEDEDEDEDDGETIGDVFDTLTEKQKKAVYAIIGTALQDQKGESMSQAAEDDDDEDETVGDVFDTLSEKQKKAVYIIIGSVLEDAGVSQSALDDYEEGDDIMGYNVFDRTDAMEQSAVPKRVRLTEEQTKEIFQDAMHIGSLKRSVLQHAQTYGIENIEVFFPDAQPANNAPDIIKRRTEWVNTVLTGTKHTPFANVKSMAVDLTEADARAKGYIKGKKKMEEVIKALKRVTTPQTVYKKQKLERDDLIDITSFDIVAFLRAEMRLMLDEEIARAILIGDGRSVTSEDKIDEEHIRPIWTDDDLYSIKIDLPADTKTAALVDEIVRGKSEYEGTGMPVLFVPPAVLTDMLLLKEKADSNVRLYRNETELAAALRVSKVVEVPVMANQTRTISSEEAAVRDVTAGARELVGIMVNVADYNIGTNQGGQVSMFDDFDIDYNAYKYLLETRLSGALVKPKSAVVFEKAVSSSRAGIMNNRNRNQQS